MEIYERKAIFEELEKWDVLSKSHSFIEVTDWKNGEGFDVVVEADHQERFSLTWGQWKCLKKMVKKLNKL